MAFVFRLEKVLRFRQNLVDEQARRLALAERAVAGVQAGIAAVEDDMQRVRNDCGAVQAGPVSVQALMARTVWLEHLEDVRSQLVADLIAAQEESHQQREALKSAWRDLEVLKTLRTKKKAVWRAEQERQEGRTLDEVGQIRADRQRRSKVAS